MDTGDTAHIKVYVTGAAKVVDMTTDSYFSGYLVC